jgi:hypothetical protein
MIKQITMAMIFLGVISSGIVLGSRSSHATPSPALTIDVDGTSLHGNADIAELSSATSGMDDPIGDGPVSETIEMATCDEFACDASCIARGFCEGGCRTTGKCTCLGHPPVCP